MSSNSSPLIRECESSWPNGIELHKPIQRMMVDDPIAVHGPCGSKVCDRAQGRRFSPARPRDRGRRAAAFTGRPGRKDGLCLVLAGPSCHPRTVSLRVGLRRGAETSMDWSADHGLMAGLTAEENVAIPLQARHLEPTEISRRTALAWNRWAWRPSLSPVDDLSGVSASVSEWAGNGCDPLVLVADEPTAELIRKPPTSVSSWPSTPTRQLRCASDDPEVVDAFPEKLSYPMSHSREIGVASDLGKGAQ